MYDVDEWIKRTQFIIESEVKADDSIRQIGLYTKSERSYQNSAVRRVVL